MHFCAAENLVNIGLGNGSSHICHQAITWNSDGLLLIKLLL